MVRGRMYVSCVAAVACIALVTLAPTAALAARSSQRAALASLELSVVDQINLIRIAHGLVPLTPSPGLIDAATAHCEQMISDGFFAHTSATGVSFAARVARYYPAAGKVYYSVGENILWSAATIDGSDVIGQWMQSPEHRANILSPKWRQIGVAAFTVPDAQGAFGGQTVTIVTTDFGVRV